MKKTKYPCSQTTLYAICVLAWQMCRDHFAAFFAFDPKYTEGYIAENLARIKAAENLPDYKARQEDLALASIAYDKVAIDLALLAKYLKSYVERAFKGDKAVQKVMLTTAGFDYFTKVQDFDDKAITPFMSAALKFIADKTVVLTTDGKMPTDFTARFIAVDVLFDDVLARYNAAKSSLLVKTDEKNAANNDIYDRVQDMLYDGRFMNMETPDLAKPYNFNTIWDQVEPTRNSGISGKIFAVGGKKPLAGITVLEPLTGKTAVSDKDGNYMIYLTEDTYALTFSGDGFVTQTVADIAVKTGVVKRLNVEMVAVAK